MKRVLSIAAAIAMVGGAIAHVQADSCHTSCGRPGEECGAIRYETNNSGSLECGGRLWTGGRDKMVGVSFTDSQYFVATAQGLDTGGHRVCATSSSHPDGVTVWSTPNDQCVPNVIDWIHYRMIP